ncbi:SAM-dependent methyltransferase [Streptomyces sp. WP-1]|nr:SAM-dependent methyltransferase [Streptomyces sp. WP-1]WKE73617.1 SAM-dependent methyltransferase [Streptomyces sp. WP-1]
MTEEQKHEHVQPSGVWATAVGVARVRALKTERENALFRDPLAQAFATAGGLGPSVSTPPGDEAARRRRLGVAFSIVIRTKFPDDLLRQASASGIRQVVLLGAGMDGRAFRMDWPAGTRLFEVDTAAPLDFRALVLRQEQAVARCERITVPVDLREDWPGALVAAGHDPAVPPPGRAPSTRGPTPRTPPPCRCTTRPARARTTSTGSMCPPTPRRPSAPRSSTPAMPTHRAS